MVDQRNHPLTEESVREIAKKFVTQKNFDKCQIVSIRRGADLDSEKPVWYVQFQFESAENESACHTFVQIDDATGAPKLIESL
jgi:hypothetical protein